MAFSPHRFKAADGPPASFARRCIRELFTKALTFFFFVPWCLPLEHRQSLMFAMKEFESTLLNIVHAKS
jgi:hypothetical protein